MTTIAFELSGELTIYAAQDIRQRLLEQLEHLAAEGPDCLEIDVSGITEADTAGVQLLLAARNHAEACGAGLRLVAPSQALTEVLSLLGLDGHFDVRLPGGHPASLG